MSYKKNNTSSVIRDVTQIAAKVSWKGALWLGGISFMIFYFIVPAWLSTVTQEQHTSFLYPVIESLASRRTHWSEWLGITCGLIGLFFSFRNYAFEQTASPQERTLIGFLAKLFSRFIN